MTHPSRESRTSLIVCKLRQAGITAMSRICNAVVTRIDRSTRHQEGPRSRRTAVIIERAEVKLLGRYGWLIAGIEDDNAPVC